MDLVEKLEPVLIFGAIILGLLFKDVTILNQISPYLINIFLALMLFAVFLDVPLEDIKNSFYNRRFTVTSLLINFLWTPLFGYFLGDLFLHGNINLLLGFFMLILTPCTDWYLLFTKMAKGDVPLSLSILPINLVLQLVLLPVYLLLFFSNSNTLNILSLANSLLTFIVIPFITAQIVKYVLQGRSIKSEIISFFSSYQTIFLCIAIFGLFNTEASNLFDNINIIGIVFIPLILFFIMNFILDYIVARRSGFNYEDYASLTLTTLARNSPLALAIAISSFPDNQLVAIALVIGPLIELPVLYIVSKILLQIRKNY
ncbi:arsenic resistance protein [Methanosphaera sp. Vir-13MRS]|uniref:arsenic resistance protein n=1 Tax=Candidatus Methanosphaera massiliense TaxID=3017187 RepID=UPI002380683B|nr:bile acid:sodium symporter [Candidatus Methanosphaera massiliense]MDE4077732.1 arsenic resistance protein [Candidatus Methanosphaera massiliense]